MLGGVLLCCRCRHGDCPRAVALVVIAVVVCPAEATGPMHSLLFPPLSKVVLCYRLLYVCIQGVLNEIRGKNSCFGCQHGAHRGPLGVALCLCSGGVGPKAIEHMERVRGDLTTGSRARRTVI